MLQFLWLSIGLVTHQGLTLSERTAFSEPFHGISKTCNAQFCKLGERTSLRWFISKLCGLKLCLLLGLQLYPILPHFFCDWLGRANEPESQHLHAIFGLLSGKFTHLKLELSTGLSTSKYTYIFLFLSSSTPTNIPLTSIISLQQTNTLDYSSLFDYGSRRTATL